MRRHLTLWLLLTAYLFVVGLWSGAVAPVAIAGAGLAAVIGAIPGPVLIGVAAVAYLRYLHHRPAAKPATA